MPSKLGCRKVGGNQPSCVVCGSPDGHHARGGLSYCAVCVDTHSIRCWHCGRPSAGTDSHICPVCDNWTCDACLVSAGNTVPTAEQQEAIADVATTLAAATPTVAGPEGATSLNGGWLLADGYYISGEMWRAMQRWDSQSKQGTTVNLLLLGMPSEGKTSLGVRFAELTARPCFVMDCPSVSEPKEWLLHHDLSSGTLKYKETAFAQAIRTPRAVCVLDEISWLQDERLLAPLFSITDWRRQTHVQGIGQVSVAADVIFWASANVGASFQGAQALNPAWRSRFRTVKLQSPPAAVIEQILRRVVAGIDKATAKLLAQIMETARSESTETPVDLRQIIAAANDIAAGATLDDAVELTFGHAFDDGETGDNRESIRRVIDSCRKRG